MKPDVPEQGFNWFYYGGPRH